MPDGDSPRGAAAARPAHAPADGVSLRQALSSPRFWWYFAAILMASVGLFVALVHINPHAQALGVSSTRAALLIGLIGAGNVAGRLVLGELGDRIGPQRLLIGLDARPGRTELLLAAGERLLGACGLRDPVRSGQRRLHRALSVGRGPLVRHHAPGFGAGRSVSQRRDRRADRGELGRAAVRSVPELRVADRGQQPVCRGVGGVPDARREARRLPRNKGRAQRGGVTELSEHKLDPQVRWPPVRSPRSSGALSAERTARSLPTRRRRCLGAARPSARAAPRVRRRSRRAGRRPS